MTAFQRSVDVAVRAVMGRGWIMQGYIGRFDVSKSYVARWLADGALLNAWWFAFCSAVQAEYRKIVAC